jgi:hypothetical protein
MENHYWLGFACAVCLMLLVGLFSFFVSRAAAREKQK